HVAVEHDVAQDLGRGLTLLAGHVQEHAAAEAIDGVQAAPRGNAAGQAVADGEAVHVEDRRLPKAGDEPAAEVALALDDRRVRGGAAGREPVRGRVAAQDGQDLVGEGDHAGRPETRPNLVLRRGVDVGAARHVNLVAGGGGIDRALNRLEGGGGGT